MTFGRFQLCRLRFNLVFSCRRKLDSIITKLHKTTPLGKESLGDEENQVNSMFFTVDVAWIFSACWTCVMTVDFVTILAYIYKGRLFAYKACIKPLLNFTLTLARELCRCDILVVALFARCDFHLFNHSGIIFLYLWTPAIFWIAFCSHHKLSMCLMSNKKTSILV